MGIKITGDFTPAVEIPHDLHPFGIGGPDRKVSPLTLAQGHRMGTQMFVKAIMIPLVEQIHILFRQEAGPMLGQRPLLL